MSAALMKAVRLLEYGDLDGLRVEDIPVPQAGPGEVLVHVRAAAVNPVDWKIATGELRGMFDVPLPHTLGEDVSGEVVSVGDGVEDFAAGDEVFGMAPATRAGTFAVYAVLKAEELAPKPKSLSHEEAASLPLTALTAWQALHETARLTEGQHVLIHAASGGVGSAAVQLAKILGAYVTGTASADHKELVTALGANAFLDYRENDLSRLKGDVDVVLDTVGGETQTKSIEVLKSGGCLVSLVQPPDPEEMERRGVRGEFILTRPDGGQLRQIGGWVEEGKLSPIVEETYPLDEAVIALKESRAGHVGGKLVLTI